MAQDAKILKLHSKDKVDAKQKICDAAIECFQQYGPQRTSMADIAEKSGISRKTLYRVFDDRATLIEYILQQRMYILGEKVSKRLSKTSNFEEGIVEGSIYAVRVSKADKLFNEIIKRDTNHRVEMFLFGPRGDVKSAIIEIWSGVIKMGREGGHIRENISDERVVDLLANIHSMLLIRDDYTEEDQREFLVDFLLPALRP